MLKRELKKMTIDELIDLVRQKTRLWNGPLPFVKPEFKKNDTYNMKVFKKRLYDYKILYDAMQEMRSRGYSIQEIFDIV